MKRAISIVMSMILILSGITVIHAEENPISSTAVNGEYHWDFSNASGENTYNYNDDYAAVRIGVGVSDSINAEKGITWSGPSCKETNTADYENTSKTNRYIFVRPEYSGKLYIKVKFTNTANSTKGRLYYNDFNSNEFDSIEISQLAKGMGTQIGADITDTNEKTLSFDVAAGHSYSIHSYVFNGGLSISDIYYTSDEIIARTAIPVINQPIISSDTELSGTCEENAVVSVKINDEATQKAEVNGTIWMLSGITLNENDIISVTAKKYGENESIAAKTTVLAATNIFSLTIDDIQHGSITASHTGDRIPAGTQITLTVLPDSTHKLKTLKINNTPVDVINGTYTFAINENTIISAEFIQRGSYAVTLPQNTENGSIIASSGVADGKALAGDTVTLDVKPDSGYRIKTLTYTSNGQTVNIKYSKSFEMPETSVEISADFEELKIVSEIDYSFKNSDRLTMNIDGKPFFYNGVQIRADKAIDSWGYTDAQTKHLFELASQDGFTVANTQIRWMDIQPDKSYTAEEMAYINGEDTNIGTDLYIQKGDTVAEQSMTYLKFNIPDTSVAGAKIRVYINSVSGTGSLHLYAIDDDEWSASDLTWDNAPCHSGYEITGIDLGTTASWDVVNKSAYYDIDVTDVINNSNDLTASFILCADNAVMVSINNSDKAPQLVLSHDDVYDFTYLDKMIQYAEECGLKLEILWFAIDTCQQSADSRVPYYVLNNYQKTMASDGTPVRQRGTTYSFLMCKEDKALRTKEQEIVETIFNHIAEYNKTHGNNNTVVGCQVTNEPAVARMHDNSDGYKYNDRCYCENCDAKYNSFIENGESKQDYLDSVMWNYQNSIAEAVKLSDYSVWTRTNNYGGTDANIVEYNEQMRKIDGTYIDFIGFDPYDRDVSVIYNYGHSETQMTKVSVDYSTGLNLPMIMENDGKFSNSAQLTLAALAGGAFYNVYEICGPDNYGLYTKGNDGIPVPRGEYIEDVRSINFMLNKIGNILATKQADGAGGEQLIFFNPKSDNTKTSTKPLRGINITYNTENGVGIAAEQSSKEIVLESSTASQFVLSNLNDSGIVSVETGAYNENGEWVKDGAKAYNTNGDDIIIELNEYDCVRISTENSIPEKEVITPVTGEAKKYEYKWNFGETTETNTAGIYNYSDKYADIRTAIASGDSITQLSGITFSGASCMETNSAQDTGRYILIKPSMSGELTIKMQYVGATSSGRGCMYLSDFGENADFDSVDLSVLKKDIGTKFGDVRDTDEHTFILSIEAGHTYSMHTYNKGASIKEMSYSLGEDNSDYIFKNVTMDEDNKLNVELEYQGAEENPTAVLIAAAYNGGVLDDVKTYNISGTTVNFGTDGYTAEADKTLKLFVWNSLDGMKPLSYSYETEIKESSVLQGKSVYAFGDSIVYGHNEAG